LLNILLALLSIKITISSIPETLPVLSVLEFSGQPRDDAPAFLILELGVRHKLLK
jgi:hypothetical protein